MDVDEDVLSRLALYMPTVDILVRHGDSSCRPGYVRVQPPDKVGGSRLIPALYDKAQAPNMMAPVYVEPPNIS